MITYHKNGETLIVANAPPPAADIGGSDPGCAETFPPSVSIFFRCFFFSAPLPARAFEDDDENVRQSHYHHGTTVTPAPLTPTPPPPQLYALPSRDTAPSVNSVTGTLSRVFFTVFLIMAVLRFASCRRRRRRRRRRRGVATFFFAFFKNEKISNRVKKRREYTRTRHAQNATSFGASGVLL